MTGMTDFITTARWSDIFTIWFVLVDDAYRALEAELGKCRSRGPAPQFSDTEVLTVALIAETYFNGHEEKTLSFIRNYHADMFPKLLPNGQFNYRRRLLCRITELIRRYIIVQWQLISPADRLRLIDSAPVELSTYTRGKECESVAAQSESSQEFFGICSSKGAKYFGVKLCLTATTGMVVDDWLLAPASLHDSNLSGAMIEDLADMQMLGDGAFHKPLIDDIVARREVQLLTPPRRDSRWPWPPELRAVVGKLRRRIETTLSVLETVFHIEQPGSRSADGLLTRVATKLLAYTLCFITQPLLLALGFETPN